MSRKHGDALIGAMAAIETIFEALPAPVRKDRIPQSLRSSIEFGTRHGSLMNVRLSWRKPTNRWTIGVCDGCDAGKSRV